MHDVRLAYIQFALSFLIAGDDNTIGQVLEIKGRSESLVPWESVKFREAYFECFFQKRLQPLAVVLRAGVWGKAVSSRVLLALIWNAEHSLKWLTGSFMAFVPKHTDSQP